MQLLFKQRMFSWFGSYDIYGETGETVYTVKGQMAWGHCFKIFDPQGACVGMVKQRLFSWLPKFEIYLGEQYLGCISREFSFFRPRYNVDCNGWHIEGDWMEWDYQVKNQGGAVVATVSKKVLNWTDTYVIDVEEPRDTLCALMLVLSIDAEKS